jgi:hypothetical protein
MTGRRRALALMAVVGLGGALIVARTTWHWRSGAKSSTELASTDPAHRSEVEDLQRNVASLEAALAQTQQRLGHVEADKGPREAAPPAPATEPTRPGLTAEQLEEARQKVLDEYKLRARTFESEVADPAWAKREEDRISAAIKTALPEGAKVENASCRTSTCKIEIAFSKEEDQRPFGMAFSNVMDGESVRAYHFDLLDRRPDGTFPLQVLVFRSGYPMPGFAE